MYYYGRNTLCVMPEDLIAYAWSAPMRDLAQKLDMSDVGLRKLLAGYGVGPPPQGYWNKVRAGKPVPKPPRPEPRRAGQTGRLNVDTRLAPWLTATTPMSSAGPFASKYVPEDLEELRATELKAICKVAVPKSLERYHPGLSDLMKKDAKRRAKHEASRWNWDAPKFDGPLDQRKLRLLNALFLTLARRGHSGSVYERDEDLQISATIGSMALRLTLAIAGKHRSVLRSGYTRAAPDLPASTPLVLQVQSFRQRGLVLHTWQDDETGKLESKLAEIAAALIVSGEQEFRQGLRKDEEEAERARIEREAKEEQARIERERRRTEKLEEQRRERVEALRESGRRMREASDIRALVLQLGETMATNPDIDEASFAAWQSWALGEADKIDPFASGQILEHLHAPTLGEDGQ